MKNQLSALDIFILVNELKGKILIGKIQKIYSSGERGLKLKIYSENQSRELVLMPSYFCFTKYPRKTEKQPSSFIMKLRKHIQNSVIKEFNQHDFDRILEFTLERKNEKFFLILELFSKGNIFLCDENKKILDLLEWQRWKDRSLGVGKVYQYPPKTQNPFALLFSNFKELLNKSKKTLVATLAIDFNLGGTYAEEICLLSQIGKEKNTDKLTDQECERIFHILQKFLKKAKDDELKPAIVFEKNKPVDILPFDLKIYKAFEKKQFKNFNDAVDEYFSELEFQELENKSKGTYRLKLEKLERVRETQQQTIENLKKKEIESKDIADTIYQNFSTIEKILKLVKETENREELVGKEIDGIKIKNIEKTSLIIEI